MRIVTTAGVYQMDKKELAGLSALVKAGAWVQKGDGDGLSRLVDMGLARSGKLGDIEKLRATSFGVIAVSSLKRGELPGFRNPEAATSLERIAARLAWLRKSRGWSKVKLGAVAQTSVRTIEHMELMRMSATVRILDRIGAAFSMPSYLFIATEEVWLAYWAD